ncbi:MAG: hypothetical protein NTZ35_02365 [Ignavibacteriales bacterium]|nr:hypothetical protein [Ignavibacteriales bacterium]
MKVSRYYVRIALLASVLLIGCAKKNESNPVDAGGTQIPSGPLLEISNAQRTAVFNSLKSMADSLQQVNPSAMNSALLNYFSLRPEFQASGAGPDGTVYAVFGDGRVLICGNNLADNPSGGSPSQSIRQMSQPQGLMKASSNLPGFRSVLLMNALGSRFDYADGTTGVTKMTQDVVQMFKAGGYKDVTLADATLEALKTVRGPGIFYFSTHGGTGYLIDKKTQVYSLMSATVRDSTKDVGIYKTDFDEKRITYMLFPNSKTADGRQLYFVAYGITPAFVTKYMSFPTNSLVYVTACSSNKAEMRAAFGQAGASVYGGWTNPAVGFQAFDAARFFFDRCLGTNLVAPIPAPRQRPFGWAYVLDDMNYRGLSQSVTKEGTSNLVFTSLKDDLTDLLPTLELSLFTSYGTYMTLDVQGDWGATAGKVFLNGLEQHLTKPWKPGSLEMDLPVGGGNLQIGVNGLLSNVVQLTQWDGTITYTVTGRGTLKRKITANVKMIGDIHRYRVLPGANIIWKDEAVFLLPRAMAILPSSSCVYESTGDYKNSLGEVEEQWSGGGSFPLQTLPTVEIPGGFLWGTVGDVGQTTSLDFLASATYSRRGKSSSVQAGFSTGDGSLSTIIANIGADYIFKAGSRTATVSDGTVVMSWTDFKPTYPPDPNAAR